MYLFSHSKRYLLVHEALEQEQTTACGKLYLAWTVSFFYLGALFHYPKSFNISNCFKRTECYNDYFSLFVLFLFLNMLCHAPFHGLCLVASNLVVDVMSFRT